MTLSSLRRVFFYGSFMSTGVLRAASVEASEIWSAVARDHELRFQPLANLVPVMGSTAFGILASVTGDDLERLYGAPPLASYRPVELDMQHLNREPERALCYLAPPGPPSAPDPTYVAKLLEGAEEHALPERYLEQLRALLNP